MFFLEQVKIYENREVKGVMVLRLAPTRWTFSGRVFASFGA